jgi:hypothetical protein
MDQCNFMTVKSKAAFVLRVVGGLLALPSLLGLFLGSLALRLLPWFPPLDEVFVWAVGMGLASLIGFALLKQSERWSKENVAEAAGAPPLQQNHDEHVHS